MLVKKPEEKKWSRKDYEKQLSNLSATCKTLDIQNEDLRNRNIALVTKLNETVSQLSQVLTNLTK